MNRFPTAPFHFVAVRVCTTLRLLLMSLALSTPAFAELASESTPSSPSARCETWRTPDLFDASWERIDFGSACAAHQACYESEGTSWTTCNQQYHDDLRGACVKGLSADESLAKARARIDDPSPTLALCFDIATQFLARAQRPTALRRFQRAQEIAARSAETTRAIAAKDPAADENAAPIVAKEITEIQASAAAAGAGTIDESSATTTAPELARALGERSVEAPTALRPCQTEGGSSC